MSGERRRVGIGQQGTGDPRPSGRSILHIAEHPVDHRRGVGTDGEVAGDGSASEPPVSLEQLGIGDDRLEVTGDRVDHHASPETDVALLAKEGQVGDGVGVAPRCLQPSRAHVCVTAHVPCVVVLEAAERVERDGLEEFESLLDSHRCGVEVIGVDLEGQALIERLVDEQRLVGGGRPGPALVRCRRMIEASLRVVQPSATAERGPCAVVPLRLDRVARSRRASTCSAMTGRSMMPGALRCKAAALAQHVCGVIEQRRRLGDGRSLDEQVDGVAANVAGGGGTCGEAEEAEVFGWRGRPGRRFFVASLCLGRVASLEEDVSESAWRTWPARGVGAAVCGPCQGRPGVVEHGVHRRARTSSHHREPWRAGH